MRVEIASDVPPPARGEARTCEARSLAAARHVPGRPEVRRRRARSRGRARAHGRWGPPLAARRGSEGETEEW